MIILKDILKHANGNDGIYTYLAHRRKKLVFSAYDDIKNRLLECLQSLLALYHQTNRLNVIVHDASNFIFVDDDEKSLTSLRQNATYTLNEHTICELRVNGTTFNTNYMYYPHIIVEYMAMHKYQLHPLNVCYNQDVDNVDDIRCIVDSQTGSSRGYMDVYGFLHDDAE